MNMPDWFFDVFLGVMLFSVFVLVLFTIALGIKFLLM